MQPNFLSLPPCKRYARIKHLLHAFADNANIVDSPIIILAYGSSSYGFNRANKGKLDDIDMFLIVERGMSFRSFVAMTRKIFLAKIDYPKAHLADLQAGRCDICRMYGHVDNVKIGFRIMCVDTFMEACTHAGSLKSLRNIASIGQSRIVRDKEWSLRARRYIPVTYDHEYVSVGGEQVLLVMQYAFSKGGSRLGPLGRKLLTCTVIHDVCGLAINSLEQLWSIFVERSRRRHPGITAEQMIGSIMRSDRFSPAFRDKLRQRIAALAASDPAY